MNGTRLELLQRAQRLLSLLDESPEYQVMLHGKRLTDRTQFTHKHQAAKRKGGSAPVEFNVVELKADLEQLIKSTVSEPEEIATLLLQLERLLNF